MRSCLAASFHISVKILIGLLNYLTISHKSFMEPASHLLKLLFAYWSWWINSCNLFVCLESFFFFFYLLKCQVLAHSESNLGNKSWIIACQTLSGSIITCIGYHHQSFSQMLNSQQEMGDLLSLQSPCLKCREYFSNVEVETLEYWNYWTTWRRKVATQMRDSFDGNSCWLSCGPDLLVHFSCFLTRETFDLLTSTFSWHCYQLKTGILNLSRAEYSR